MTQPLIAIAALAVAFFCPLTARAQAPEHLKSKGASERQIMVETLLRLENEIMEAIRVKDAKRLEGKLADNFVYRTLDADVSRADFLRNIAALPGNILSVEGASLRVSIYGETAVLTGVQHARVRMGDGSEQTGKTAFTDVFVRRRGQWLLVLAYGVELPMNSIR
jgi:ketosteroid isomerase-like protein